ncbi:tail fiber domain-containing protein [Pedobacter deserti]|uniref:tail fiber domain-containing protein n=1 Tax=Pedobacter deserti TaxID=2817382 RepID=UPI00210A8BCC|nr:tail fiber domain-containing protein [Pedobacter sp. SYSU D00382]
MKYSMLGKVSLMGLLLSVTAVGANAQKIDEKELKIGVGQISNTTRQLTSLQPVVFKYDVEKFKHLNLPAGEHYGFLASDVAAAFPGLVKQTSKQYPSGKNSHKVATYSEVDTKELIPVLVAAIKEQQEQIESLKVQLNQLKQKAK